MHAKPSEDHRNVPVPESVFDVPPVTSMLPKISTSRFRLPVLADDAVWPRGNCVSDEQGHPCLPIKILQGH